MCEFGRLSRRLMTDHRPERTHVEGSFLFLFSDLFFCSSFSSLGACGFPPEPCRRMRAPREAPDRSTVLPDVVTADLVPGVFVGLLLPLVYPPLCFFFTSISPLWLFSPFILTEGFRRNCEYSLGHRHTRLRRGLLPLFIVLIRLTLSSSPLLLSTDPKAPFRKPTRCGGVGVFWGLAHWGGFFCHPPTPHFLVVSIYRMSPTASLFLTRLGMQEVLRRMRGSSVDAVFL